jgi:hypothetical protein
LHKATAEALFFTMLLPFFIRLCLNATAPFFAWGSLGMARERFVYFVKKIPRFVA